MDRIQPTVRPSGKCKGYQTWSDLSFLHWRVSLDSIRELVPRSLEIDTFDGEAWIGLVPFHMSNVRPRFLPAIPCLSAFHETNVRTYVHLNGERPGVWFFSLEAKNRIAVEIARKFWNLNYHYSKMTLEKLECGIIYSGNRPNRSANYEIQIEFETEGSGTELGGKELGGKERWGTESQNVGTQFAEPGTLLHFLAERYLLYTQSNSGVLLCGQVHHSPYPLVPAKTVRCDETLLSSNGISIEGEPIHTVFSPGVEVEVFALEPVDRD